MVQHVVGTRTAAGTGVSCGETPIYSEGLGARRRDDVTAIRVRHAPPLPAMLPSHRPPPPPPPGCVVPLHLPSCSCCVGLEEAAACDLFQRPLWVRETTWAVHSLNVKGGVYRLRLLEQGGSQWSAEAQLALLRPAMHACLTHGSGC